MRPDNFCQIAYGKKTWFLFLFLLLSSFSSLTAQNWNPVNKLTAIDRTAGDEFGSDVSISGDYAVVGSHWNTKDATGGNLIQSAGAAYVYKKDNNGNWVQIQKLVASDRSESDAFGETVFISGDYIFVGANLDAEDAAGSNSIIYAGSVYIFKRNANGVWEQLQKIVANDRSGRDFFGSSLSVSGNYLFVGAYGEDEDFPDNNSSTGLGATYVFQKDIAGNWVQQQKLVASDRNLSASFGFSVSVSGDYAIIGAYNDTRDQSGGNYIEFAGSVYVFKRNAATGNWAQIQKIVAPQRKQADNFGQSVAIEGDNIVVGVENEDEDANDQNTLEHAGAVYLYKRNSVNDNWELTQKIVPANRFALDVFGSDVAISGDRIIVGSRNDAYDASGLNYLIVAGSAYVFKKEISGYWVQEKKIVAIDRGQGDYFGKQVAISGGNVLIGVHFEDEDSNYGNTLQQAGSAYIFKNDTVSVPLLCNNVSVLPGQSSIAISGLTAPITMVQLSNSSWVTVFNQIYDTPPGSIVISSLPAGQYELKINFYSANWSHLCTKVGFYTVGSGGESNITLSISDTTINENDGTVTLRAFLSAPATQQVTANFVTSNASASAYTDYTSTSGNIVIPVGQTSTSITIQLVNDDYAESTEQFNVILSNAVNAVFADSIASVTILDSDTAGGPNCNSIGFTGGNNSVTFSGLTAPVCLVQLSNSTWTPVFSEVFTNAPGTVTVPSLPPGQYLGHVYFYKADWTPICEKESYVTVIAPLPCPSGTICIVACDSQTFDLNTAYSIPNLPVGTTVSWHTGTPATDLNKMTTAQASAVSMAGTYYASINIGGANCYSATIPVSVTFKTCQTITTTKSFTSLPKKVVSKKVTIAPNPFINGFVVNIDSDKEETAFLIVMDLFGRNQKSQTVKLIPGKNQVRIEGLGKLAQGSYFLRIVSGNSVESYKILKGAN